MHLMSIRYWFDIYFSLGMLLWEDKKLYTIHCRKWQHVELFQKIILEFMWHFFVCDHYAIVTRMNSEATQSQKLYSFTTRAYKKLSRKLKNTVLIRWNVIILYIRNCAFWMFKITRYVHNLSDSINLKDQ